MPCIEGVKVRQPPRQSALGTPGVIIKPIGSSAPNVHARGLRCEVDECIGKGFQNEDTRVIENSYPSD